LAARASVKIEYESDGSVEVTTKLIEMESEAERVPSKLRDEGEREEEYGDTVKFWISFAEMSELDKEATIVRISAES